MPTTWYGPSREFCGSAYAFGNISVVILCKNAFYDVCCSMDHNLCMAWLVAIIHPTPGSVGLFIPPSLPTPLILVK